MGNYRNVIKSIFSITVVGNEIFKKSVKQPYKSNFIFFWKNIYPVIIRLRSKQSGFQKTRLTSLLNSSTPDSSTPTNWIA